MTDSDIRTLKSYLAESLERPLKFAKEMMEKYAAEAAGAKESQIYLAEAQSCLAVDTANHMRSFYHGQATALQHAIDDFRELFEEELREGK